MKKEIKYAKQFTPSARRVTPAAISWSRGQVLRSYTSLTKVKNKNEMVSHAISELREVCTSRNAT